ncbi:immunoglobulin alpha-2 heavy chain-like isoform X2 [Alosa pseudoharengus]
MNSAILWMKQSAGEEPVSIASYYPPNTNFYNGFDKSDRFKPEGGANSFNLTISQTQTADSATYYCGSVYYAEVTFGKGTTVFIKDRDSDDHAVIEQLDSVSPPSGGNVTLTCSVHSGSCAEEPGVFWFRPASGDSRPGVGYSSGDNSCVYQLSRRNLSRDDAHTHYCAVAACGRIVFGNGTRVHVQASDPLGSCVFWGVPSCVFWGVLKTAVLLVSLLVFTLICCVRKNV